MSFTRDAGFALHAITDGALVKGGKAGQGRRRPPAKLDPLEKLQQKQRQGPKRGDKKKDWGANEREVPVVPRPGKR